jgi:hypothetical protein
MSSGDTSYPPFLYRLPSSHDLQLVGDVIPATLEVDFTWDSQGKSAHLDFGDGNSVTTDTETANHTYAANGIYTARVTSGSASDSAVLDLSAAGSPPEEPEETEPVFEAVKVDEIPSDE